MLYNKSQAIISMSGKDCLYNRDMSIGEWIKRCRQHAGMTQQELGDVMSKTKANVSGWENGLHSPSYEQIIRIAELAAWAIPPPGLEPLLSGLLKENENFSSGQPRSEYSPFLTSETRRLFDTWQSANAEAREVARFALSDLDAPLPPWANEAMRKDLDSMIYRAHRWLRTEQPRMAKIRTET